MKLPQLIKKERGVLRLAVTAATLLVSGTLHAGIIAEDSSVTGSGMNVGGTLDDPAIYIIGSGTAATTGTVTHSAGSTIGSTKPYNELTIQNGWTLLSQGNSYVGAWYSHTASGDQGINNTVKVTGAGSTWEVYKSGSVLTLAVGRVGAYNKLIVENQGLVKANNAYIRLGTDGGSGNSILVQSGGKVWSTLAISIGHGYRGSAPNYIGANNNHIKVTGIGSTLISDGNILVGNTNTITSGTTVTTVVTTGNHLTIEDGALVKASATTNPLSIADGNFLQLNGGYLALKLDSQLKADALLATLLSGSPEVRKIQVWDNSALQWVAATADTVTATYYALEADALTATGYAELGGYTIISAIPEAGTVGFLLIGLGSLVYIQRRKRL